MTGTGCADAAAKVEIPLLAAPTLPDDLGTLRASTSKFDHVGLGIYMSFAKQWAVFA